MTDAEKVKKCFDDIGLEYKEEKGEFCHDITFHERVSDWGQTEEETFYFDKDGKYEK